MSLIKVWTEIDDVCLSLPAKIISTKGDIYTIKYLSANDKKDAHNRKIYTYEAETYEITNDSITEYVNSDIELDLGFKEISTGEFVKYDTDSDDDYIPTSDDDYTSTDCSEDEDDDVLDDEEENVFDEDYDE